MEARRRWAAEATETQIEDWAACWAEGQPRNRKWEEGPGRGNAVASAAADSAASADLLVGGAMTAREEH